MRARFDIETPKTYFVFGVLFRVYTHAWFRAP